MKKNRVVVTGLGVVAPIGNSIHDFARALWSGQCGAGDITRFETTHFPVRKAYEVRNFNPHHYRVHILDPFIQYAIASATQAIDDSGLDLVSLDPFRIGISVSSSKGGVHTWDRYAERLRKHPNAILGARVYSSLVPNFAAQWIARRWKIQGPARCYVAACATGTVAIGEGARMIEMGTVDCCLAGASDASIVPLMLAGYNRMKVLSHNHLRPFDRRRDGFMVGEGAGILMLESLEHALARKARIYGEVAGYAAGGDGEGLLHFGDLTRLGRLLDDYLPLWQTSPEALDYINLHGTGTPAGDKFEADSLKQALGKRTEQIPMSSIKGMTGHMLGASGAVEAIACLLAMRDGFLPPTAGLEEQDPECPLDCIPGQARKANVQQALSLSMGFGGHLAVLLLRRFS